MEGLQNDVSTVAPKGLRGKKWYIYGLVMLSTTLQSMVSAGFVNAAFSTIEKRFFMSSKLVGVISGCAHAGVLLATLPLSFMGEKKQAPKLFILGLSLLVTGIASGMFWLAEVIEPARPVDSLDPSLLCLLKSGDDASSPEGSFSMSALVLLSVGNFVCGIGTAAFYPIGNSYLHDIFPEDNLKILIGVWQTTFFVGPALGFTLEGLALRGQPSDASGGLGGWWVPFTVSAVACIVLGIVMAVGENFLKMPFQVEESLVKNSLEQNTRPKKKSVAERLISLKTSTVEVFVSSIKLLRLPTFGLLVLGMATDVSINSALSPFLPKLTENQFNVSPSAAAMAVGVPVTGAVLAGTVIGSVISAKMSLTARGLTIFYVLSHLAVVALGPFFLLHCPQREIHGLDAVEKSVRNVVYNTSILYEECNKGCNCPAVIQPACADPYSERVFLNPCFGGCKLKDDVGQTFSQCSCLREDSQKVSVNACGGVCNSIYLFIFLLTLTMTFFYMPNATNVLLLGRSAPLDQRTLATGLQSFFGRLVAGIPSPLAYGAILEASCLIKEEKCILYNTETMGVHTAIFLAAIKALGIVFFLVAIPFTSKTDQVG